MKKILISNIGNRNIAWNGEIIPVKNFRNETEKIWNNLDREKSKISIHIISNHISTDTEKIVLISTCQKNEEYNYQDTFFEGKILKQLLEKKYQIPVLIETFNGNPTDENEVFAFYADFFKKLLAENSQQKLVFNDAGGTPQMKLVVKEMLEYYLSSDKYDIVYSDQNDVKRQVERIYKNKYVLLKTARKFVNEFNYNAAIRVLQEIPENAGVTANLKKLIAIASKRINFEIEEVRKEIRTDLGFQKSFLKVFSHLNQKLPPGNAIPFKQIKPEFKLEIFELASICQLYFNMSNYTLAVATYYRLTEEVFHRFVHSFGQYKLSSLKERERFMTENIDGLKEAYKHFNNTNELRESYGLPVLAMYCLKYGDEDMKVLANLFMKTISLFRPNPREGIDLLRNQCFLAHKNRAVTVDLINKTEPQFLNNILPEIFNTLQMPNENIYFTMNRLINREFLKN